MPKKKAPSERAYARLTRHGRQAIERMPDRGEGAPRGRPGDRPRAVDGRQRGGEAPVRDVAAAFGALPGDAFGVGMLEPAELDLTPGCVERARVDRGEAPLAE